MRCFTTQQKNPIFDSLLTNELELKAIGKQFFYCYKQFAKFKIQKNIGDFKDWSITVATCCPKQINGDCGLFTCQFLECVSRNAPFYLNGNDMYHLRKVMQYELLDKMLLPRPNGITKGIVAIPSTIRVNNLKLMKK